MARPWNPLRGAVVFGGGLLAMGLWASQFSFARLDPTLTNLRLPSGGVSNWIGYPGALVGGSLVELFGASSFAIPLLLINRLAQRPGPPGFLRYWANSLVLLCAAAALHGMFGGWQPPGIGAPGLVGWMISQWALQGTGQILGGLLLGMLLMLAGKRVAYRLPWSRIVQDTRIFMRFGRERITLRIALLWRKVSQNGLRTVQGLDYGLKAASVWLSAGFGRRRRQAQSAALRAYGLIAALRFATVGKIKAARSLVPGELRRAGKNGGGAKAENQAYEKTPDGFDEWFTALGGNTREAAISDQAKPDLSGDPPTEHTQPPRVSHPKEEFERQFERFTRDMDLDWQPQVPPLSEALESTEEPPDEKRMAPKE